MSPLPHPNDIASHLQNPCSTTFRLLQCSLEKLWHKAIGQTSKIIKSCSADPAFLKLRR